VAEVFPLERIPEPVRAIARRLRDAGHETWFVGGAVRDVLLERLRPGSRRHGGEVDITTGATPDVVRALFRRTVPIGIEHGTVAVLDDAGRAHEVTTFRRDVATDGRHAVVQFGVSIGEDLARRDLTINAIAVHPESGEFLDPFGGREDLAAGLVRAVGDAAQRFLEDRLRILRALRFAAVLDFAIEPGTWRAVTAQAGELAHLSRERVRDEWLKSLAAPAPGGAVRLWSRAGVLGAVWPELAGLRDEDFARLDALDLGETRPPARAAQPADHGHGAAASGAAPAPGSGAVPPADPVLVTAAAFALAASAPAAAGAAAQRLRFSSRDGARVQAVVAALADPVPPAARPGDVRRWLARHRAVAGDAIAVSEPASRRPELRAAVRAVEAAGDALSLRELAVTGEDLQAAGVPAGKEMGDVLRRLLEEVLEEPARNTRDALLRRARELRA
jgi:tRNA nucleotidyltransferase (CCA-adding enzyme)